MRSLEEILAENFVLYGGNKSSKDIILDSAKEWLNQHIQDCTNNYCMQDTLKHLLQSLYAKEPER